MYCLRQFDLLVANISAIQINNCVYIVYIIMDAIAIFDMGAL